MAKTKSTHIALSRGSLHRLVRRLRRVKAFIDRGNSRELALEVSILVCFADLVRHRAEDVSLCLLVERLKEDRKTLVADNVD